MTSSDLLHTVVRVLDRGLNTSSYKFALLRALADIAVESASDTVAYTTLAESFITYYWPLTVVARVRQSVDPAKDPVIMGLIRREVDALNLGVSCSLRRYQTKWPERHSRLVEACSHPGGCFDDVIPRFHIVHRQHVLPALYEAKADHLRLCPGVRLFLREHHSVLEHLALGAWVRFTEQFSTAPRLYQKIAGSLPPRRSKRFCGFLTADQEGRCFYCARHAGSSPHVDHVIPRAFVWEDQLWNLVLACSNCNLEKRERIADDDDIDQLIARNARLLQTLRGTLLGGAPHPQLRSLREFLTIDLAEHIRALAATCRTEGFGTWTGPAGTRERPGLRAPHDTPRDSNVIRVPSTAPWPG
jgi:5-methylcytosine-specific restriction endonuclease McrA